jgi:hypothetical protein
MHRRRLHQSTGLLTKKNLYAILRTHELNFLLPSKPDHHDAIWMPSCRLPCVACTNVGIRSNNISAPPPPISTEEGIERGTERRRVGGVPHASPARSDQEQTIFLLISYPMYTSLLLPPFTNIRFWSVSRLLLGYRFIHFDSYLIYFGTSKISLYY